jgi:large subunit ribosomal protein L9
MGTVRLILREDVVALGDAGDVVDVKPGYARNYLLPQGKAILATAARVNELEHHKRVITEQLARQLKELRAVKQKLEGISLEFRAQVGEEGRLFGSVTAQQVAEQLAEKGMEIDRRKIVLAEPIKTIGEHTVTIRLQGELTADVKVRVEAAE